jgi:hypothetical protein
MFNSFETSFRIDPKISFFLLRGEIFCKLEHLLWCIRPLGRAACGVIMLLYFICDIGGFSAQAPGRYRAHF